MQLIDAAELAEMLGCHPHTLRRWVRDGLAPRPIRLGRRCVRWSRADVLAWLANLKRETDHVRIATID